MHHWLKSSTTFLKFQTRNEGEFLYSSFKSNKDSWTAGDSTFNWEFLWRKKNSCQNREKRPLTPESINYRRILPAFYTCKVYPQLCIYDKDLPKKQLTMLLYMIVSSCAKLFPGCSCVQMPLLHCKKCTLFCRKFNYNFTIKGSSV